MSRMHCAAALGLAVIAVGGCKQPDRAKTTPPTRTELPAFAELEQRLPIVVGVEGAARTSRVRIVPDYKPIEPTAEERAILRLPPEPELDVLAFYRPQRGPADGVASEAFNARIGIGGLGGPMVGRGAATSRAGTRGVGGAYVGIGNTLRTTAAVGQARSTCGRSEGGWNVVVGEGPARTRAGRATTQYR